MNKIYSLLHSSLDLLWILLFINNKNNSRNKMIAITLLYCCCYFYCCYYCYWHLCIIASVKIKSSWFTYTDIHKDLDYQNFLTFNTCKKEFRQNLYLHTSCRRNSSLASFSCGSLQLVNPFLISLEVSLAHKFRCEHSEHSKVLSSSI